MCAKYVHVVRNPERAVQKTRLLSRLFGMTLGRTNAAAIDFPTMEGIFTAARSRGVSLELKTFGPFFRVVARSTEQQQQQQIGTANGFIKPWLQGPILHLDSIRMTKAAYSSLEARPLFGVGILMGAAAVRHGYDCGCRKAELLAINDGNLYHAKLVKYYARLGFSYVCEVTGESVRDLPHLLVWGGLGTRMDADVAQLLAKWARYFESLNHEP